MASFSAIPGAAHHQHSPLKKKVNDDYYHDETLYHSTTPVVTPFQGEAPTLTISPGDMEEQVLSDLEKSPRTSSQRKQSKDASISMDGTTGIEDPPEESARAVPNEADDDEDSSADDSSYFADPNNLPKPKSGGRQFSYESQQQQTAPHQQHHHVRRESNASLSLSDDSAENGPMNIGHQQHAAAAPPQARVPDMYPQQLTRMHSYSSLVSTSSQPDDDDADADESDTNGRTPLPYAASAAATTTRARNPSNYPYYNNDIDPPSNPAVPVAGGNYSRGNYAARRGQQQYQGGNYGPPPPPQMMMTPEQYQWMIIQQQQQQYHPQHHHHHHPLQQPDRSIRSPSSKDSDLAYSVESDHHRQLPTKQDGDDNKREEGDDDEEKHAFKVYWQRWIMLTYMSVLNLLSDWTCYSVAPIALLTEEAFGNINAEQLVVVFLAANVVATACEPIILSRLGLRRTVLFGALLLMMGSIVKSGGMPPIIQSSLHKGKGEWRVYVGFFLVGLSQPLYQCTPALLSASWFPEEERTMATSVALNANQLGIGFAFIFGTLLVANSDDIPHYFGLLSLISTLTFLGALLQFDDAPPTPPSDTARVMRGTLEVTLPTVQNILNSVRENFDKRSSKPSTTTTRRKSRSSHRKKQSDSAHRRRRKEQLQAPSRAPWDDGVVGAAPSPMMPGAVGAVEDIDDASRGGSYPESPPYPIQHPYPPYPGVPAYPPYVMYGEPQPPPYPHYPPYGQPLPPWGDPRNIQAYPLYPPSDPYYQYYSYQHGVLPPPPHIREYAPSHNVLPMAGGIDEGAEPVITITPHHCDIEIRDDQIILSTKACLARPGFIHSLVSFTVSGIVINTLSTFMDYLVRLNGAGRAYTGIVGGAFQFCIMISSLIVGRVCDTTRAYYSITIAMLVLGAFGLAECGVSLDSNSGSTLRYALVVVAILVGPLQPVSTELGVDVVYPLSENTVLVIQQLFSNLLSAAFIPCFKAMKDFGAFGIEVGATERPQYTFSFYLLIVLHAAATVFFATFNGRYLRYEHELEKKAKEERRKQRRLAKAFRKANHEHHQSFGSARSDHLPPPPFM